MKAYSSLSFTEKMNFTLIAFLAKAISLNELRQWAHTISPVPKPLQEDIEYMKEFGIEQPEYGTAHELMYDLEEMGIFFDLDITEEEANALEGIALERGYIPSHYTTEQKKKAENSLAENENIRTAFYEAFSFTKGKKHPYITCSPYTEPLHTEAEFREQYEKEANRFAFIKHCFKTYAITEAEMNKWVELEIGDCEDTEMIEVYADLSYPPDERREFRTILTPIESRCTFPLTREESDALGAIGDYTKGIYEEDFSRVYASSKALLECPELVRFFKTVFPFIKF